MWEYCIELGNINETIIHGEPISSMLYREVFANEGTEYSIIRTYKNKKGNMELVISSFVGAVI